ncbi:unnamed protein product, partial [Prunus brigantina]
LNSRSQRKVFALKGKRPREVHVKLGERSGGLNDGNGSLAFLISASLFRVLEQAAWCFDCF